MTFKAAISDTTGDSHHQFINRALSFTFWDNLFKPVSPLLELVCAALFVGGAWGRYKFYESLVFLVFRISLMGMDKGVIWYYSQVDERVYLKTLFRSLSWCFSSFGILSLLILGSYFGWVPHSEWVLGKNSGAFHIPGSGLLMYLLAVPMMVIAELCIQANVNKRNLKYRILVPGIAVPLVTYGSAITGHFLVPNALSLPACLLAGNCAGALLAIWGFLRVHRPGWKDVSLIPIPPWKMIRYSFPLASANIFSALASRADIFMLAGFTGVKSVEVYTVVCMIGKSLISIRQSFENILLSAFSTSGSGRLTLKLKSYFNYSTWLVMSLQGVLLAFAVLFGSEFLGFIHPEYAGGHWTLVITAFFIYVNTSSDFFALLALGLGRTYIVPLIHVIFFLVNILLNLLWIPALDSFGAAMALGVANLVSGLIYFSYLTYFNRGTPFLWDYWKPTFVNIFFLGILAALGIHLKMTIPMRAFLFVVFLGATLLWQRRYYRLFNYKLGALSKSSP